MTPPPLLRLSATVRIPFANARARAQPVPDDRARAAHDPRREPAGGLRHRRGAKGIAFFAVGCRVLNRDFFFSECFEKTASFSSEFAKFQKIIILKVSGMLNNSSAFCEIPVNFSEDCTEK